MEYGGAAPSAFQQGGHCRFPGEGIDRGWPVILDAWNVLTVPQQHPQVLLGGCGARDARRQRRGIPRSDWSGGILRAGSRPLYSASPQDSHDQHKATRSTKFVPEGHDILS